MERKEQIKELYEEVWKEIVENEDGTLNKEAVMEELFDFNTLMDTARAVNYEVSGGMMSYCSYTSAAVIEQYEANVERQIEVAIEEHEDLNKPSSIDNHIQILKNKDEIKDNEEIIEMLKTLGTVKEVIDLMNSKKSGNSEEVMAKIDKLLKT